MAMVCDVCGEKYGHDSGNGNLRVSPPRPDFRFFQALAVAGQSYEAREPLALDLCLACTKKTLVHLGISIEGMDLPQLPPLEVDEDPPPSNTSALTDEELRKLGLLEPGTDLKI